MLDIPSDDGVRQLAVASPDDPRLQHVAVVGDAYTILISTEQTAGKYCLIDMLIPAGGGPPPHRHDFEEMFHVLDGTVEVTLRGTPTTATTGQTVNIPANAPHSFHNPADTALRLLCLASPGGLDQFFLGFGDLLDSRDSPAPELTAEQLAQRMARAAELAPRYRIDMLQPPPGEGQAAG
jgi:quercetin dioxygenase-like cupin family protein